MSDPPGVVLEGAYRAHAGLLTAALTRLLGPARLETVEAVLHDTFAHALTSWTEAGIPDNPPGWLLTAARRRALDELRRDKRARGRASDAPIDEIADETQQVPRAVLRGELADDQLRMMFVSCHPALALPSQLALTLRTLCGLTVAEIAKLFLGEEAALEKRLVRARQTLRELEVRFDLPAPAELSERLGVVLRVLYLLFSEGYSAHSGERQIREELCQEAIRLVKLLVERPEFAKSQTHALAALMLLQASRLPARLDARGRLLTLAEQDRGRWDRVLLAQGLEELAASAEGARVTDYHLEAGIAACHAMAPSFDATDWRRIVGYYDRLLELNDSPVIRLNRAIAFGRAESPKAALRELSALEKDPRLASYGLLGAARADLLALSGDIERARAAYERALALPLTDPERDLLRRRLSELA